ncbi:LOW QUALITY PROTEIN: protein transport protein Sec16A [Brienomyrus brachyistius]|uniref:LOW QUALITY PROTEIN: protein transport protein Sec16A n=1 Tax=Brienomyrus brachyistius TaxID=42636 RepID=UPI0020B1B7A5|nr:LOW QUALITY PROTEIN: protein transport protein Sec16A [Brienomyrus brachyistius]
MMQPPPRAGGPPPIGGIPNAFRRTRPHRQPGNPSGMLGPAQPVPPMTDPFAFGRQAPPVPPPPAGNHHPTSNSNLPVQSPPLAPFYSGGPTPGQPAHHLPEVAQGHQPMVAGVNSFVPGNVASSAPPPRQFPGLATPNAPSAEEGYLNTKEHGSYITAGALPQGVNPCPAGVLEPALYQPLVMPPTASPWMSDHGSRPPSVQNYFQPTSDNAPQPTSSSLSACPPDPSQHAAPPVPSAHASSIAPPPQASSPHTAQAAPSPYPLAQKQAYSAQPGFGGPQGTPTGPGLPEYRKPEGNAGVTQNQNSQFQAHNYFGRNCTAPDPWFTQPSREHFYHQMGGGSSDNRPNSTKDQPGPQPGPPPGPSGPLPYAADPGTVSLFFKENDVENEETLAGEGKAVNGVSAGDTFGVGYGMNMLPPSPQMPLVQSPAGSEVSQRGGLSTPADRSGPFTADPAAPYANDSGFVSGTPKQERQFDHVENLECVPNQEVLPSEPQKMAQTVSGNSAPGQAHTAAPGQAHTAAPGQAHTAAPGQAHTAAPGQAHTAAPGQAHTAAHGGVHYEGGPNLETPDFVAGPVRPESVSSSYSNVSQGSVSGARRPQGVVGTFIQQEVAKPLEDSSAGYFEQIDTSPAGEGAQQRASAKISHGQLSQPVTPSPPKPTGIFQASPNSSFEPVHAHSVGVRPFGVDQARVVAEKGGGAHPRVGVPDASLGNLEQPPDNLENIFMTSTQHPGAGVLEKRPSSRSQGARLKCESPATTLWAQNEMAITNANVVLAPAAPPVHGLVKQPSAEVIQPPEDGPLDLQVPQHVHCPPERPDHSSENLENPPKLAEADPKHPQASLGYASLLVTTPPAESFPNQPVLIAPPSTNYSLIPPNNPHSIVSNEVSPNPGVDVRILPLQQPSDMCASTAPTGPAKVSNHLEHFALPVTSSGNCRPAPNPSPLNLTPESRQVVKPDNPTAISAGRPRNSSLPQPDPLGGPNHSAPPVNSQALPLADNHKQPINELLDFAMSFPQSNQNKTTTASTMPSGAPSTAAGLKTVTPVSNSAGFYRQVTKDPQQGGSGGSELQPQPQQLADSTVPPGGGTTSAQQSALYSSHRPESQPNFIAGGAPPNPTTQPPAPVNQYPHPSVPGQAPPGPGVSVPPGTVPPGSGEPHQPPYPPQPGNSSRPPSVLGGPPGYGGMPPMPGPMYGGYYGGAYSEYVDGRPLYPPQYPPSDPRAQPYYQDDPYRRYDPRYGRHEGSNLGYRDTERYQHREQPERPSSRASQNSDRPSSRQGYSEDYQRANRSAYDGYYGDYYKNYGDRRWEHYDPMLAFDPRYRGYYDQSYWYNYDPEAYRGREGYYSQPYANRRETYGDHWRYDPRYDSSFDETCYQRDAYGDECDRRSVHSEHSTHSLRSSHSRRSSFSSRSQQSQLYRSQQDLVSATYEPPGQAPTLSMDFSYGQYPDSTDGPTSTPAGYTAEGGWPAVEQPPPRPATPEKFMMPHRCARFGPSGQMVQVLPNLPSAGQPALVEIHSMEIMLQDLPEQEDLRSFPGPLVKDETHKVDVIKFAQNKSLECQRDDGLMDKDSARLIWDFIMLLCRQNGTVVGTDIADLLLREHRSVWLPGKSPNEANLIDFTNEPLERADDEPGSVPLSLLSDTFMTVPENPGKETERFRELLLFGRKKDALESAMKNGLWGHALLLASKMDNRTHARVMTRFANSLPINDPLQTVYQLMSGRMPAAATCCGDEKWGDWRPHLAMVLSNLTHALDLDMRTVATMGDTLASKGLIDAAHFCYMMAQVGLGVYTKKSTKMVLIGSNHSLPFFRFASNEAIQRTEAYEYAQSLGSQPCSLPNFQVYKFLYACRLAEAGLCAQALHYCEVISKAVLSMPSYHSPMFINQLIQMSIKLRFFDPQLKEKPEQELFVEPGWLVRLRHLDSQIRDGMISYSSGRATPQQYACSTPSSEFDHPSPPDPMGMPMDSSANPDNALMTSLLPNPGPPLSAVQLMPPGVSFSVRRPARPPARLSRDFCTPGSTSWRWGPVLPPFRPATFVQFLALYPPHKPRCLEPCPPRLSMAPPYPMEQTYPVLPAPSQISHVQSPPSPQGHHAPPQTSSQPASPSRSTFTPQMDFYDQMEFMGPGRRSRTTSQSSMHTGQGRRSRTTSESSTHSAGRERSNSMAKPSLPTPEPIPEQPPQEVPKKQKKESPKKGSSGWLGWLYWKGKNEAHLPDDTNKSIVWDPQKKRWVNMDEPEEENKPLPPPPSSFPKMAPLAAPGGAAGPPSGGPQVNMFSRKAGTKSRYVDFLNPGGTSSKPASSVPAPAEVFAPLAPMPMPTNVFVPGAAPDEQQPLEGSVPEASQPPGQNLPSASAAPQVTKQTLYPPGQEGAPVIEGTQSGELSRSSSMSSLSREVSQHLNQVPTQTPVQGGPPAGGVTFYNPTQFAQPSPPSGGAKQGPFGQRKYLAMK